MSKGVKNVGSELSMTVLIENPKNIQTDGPDTYRTTLLRGMSEVPGSIHSFN